MKIGKTVRQFNSPVSIKRSSREKKRKKKLAT